MEDKKMRMNYFGTGAGLGYDDMNVTRAYESVREMHKVRYIDLGHSGGGSSDLEGRLTGTSTEKVNGFGNGRFNDYLL